jgi:hypothetical protein
MSETNEQMLEELSEANTGGPEDTLVTVATFPEPATANLARMALESAGIASFLHGENANTMLPIAFAARLQVRQQDETAARRLLTEADLTPETVESVTAAEVAGEDPLG